MRTTWKLILACALVASFGATAQESPQGTVRRDPIIKHTFEESEHGWMSIGDGALASITHDKAEVKTGGAALRFDYALEKGKMGALVLPIPEGALTKVKSIRLWALSSHATPLAIALSERDGGRYVAVFGAPKGAWQSVELSPTDFSISDGPDDPKDPNGKLDMELVNSVAVIDFAQMLVQADNAQLRQLLGATPGPRRMVIDDFVASEDPLPGATPVQAGVVRIDAFDHPQIGWIATAGVQTSLVPATNSSARMLQATYRQAPDAVCGMFRMVGRGRLAGTGRLVMLVASKRAVKLLVQVEESGGGKYNAMVDVAASATGQEVSLNYSEMSADKNANDPNGKLDVQEIKQLVIADLTAMAGAASGEVNVLKIGAVRSMPLR